jgi:hypothetical protein
VPENEQTKVSITKFRVSWKIDLRDKMVFEFGRVAELFLALITSVLFVTMEGPNMFSHHWILREFLK